MVNVKTLHGLLLIGATAFVVACTSPDPLLHPSGSAESYPATDLPFSDYVTESQDNIESVLNRLRPPVQGREYLGRYTNKQAAIMRGPFQVPELDNQRCIDLDSDTDRGAHKGFLLIHGLTDSPYLMTNIGDSLRQRYPCALIRAVLLPGHGTVAGDSLKMTYQQWNMVVRYGVNSFQGESAVSELFLVGFSTGTSLSVEYMKQHPAKDGSQREDKIKGLVMISAAVKANTGLAWLAGYVKYLKSWGDQLLEKDAARYESFSMNAGDQFYQLTKDMASKAYALEVPLMMAVSADDATIDARAARQFYCHSQPHPNSALIWYESLDEDLNQQVDNDLALNCANITHYGLKDINPAYKTKNLAHTALSISPQDKHYGVDKAYSNCNSYFKKSEKYEACLINSAKTVYGEKNLEGKEQELDFSYWRRGTFNPFYAELEQAIYCFTSGTCKAGRVTAGSVRDATELTGVGF